MATRTPATAQPASQLGPVCDYCKQKPKFSNFQYCSKTCANQAATLCNQCHKKPKFQNFDYCGKNCASLAGPAKTHKVAGASVPQAQAGGAPNAPNYPKGNKFNSQRQAQSGTTPATTIDPLQIAKLVVQHIPQVQAMLNSGSIGAAAPAAPATVPPQAANTLPSSLLLNATTQASAQAASSGAPNGTLAATANIVPAAQSNNISSQQAADDLECLIPGCGKPVHVDAKGLKASDYCSMRHREEAVVSGLASACIMCLVLPQSETDYFCSAACREEALNKDFDPTQLQ